MQPMYYIRLDVHKRKISYCVKGQQWQASLRSFKYRKKVGIETAVHAFHEAVHLNKRSRERLLHFRDTCRVRTALRLIRRFDSEMHK